MHAIHPAMCRARNPRSAGGAATRDPRRQPRSASRTRCRTLAIARHSRARAPDRSRATAHRATPVADRHSFASRDDLEELAHRHHTRPGRAGSPRRSTGRSPGACPRDRTNNRIAHDLPRFIRDRRRDAQLRGGVIDLAQGSALEQRDRRHISARARERDYRSRRQRGLASIRSEAHATNSDSATRGSARRARARCVEILGLVGGPNCRHSGAVVTSVL